MAKLLMIGMGAMGSAILQGVLQAGLYRADDVTVIEHSAAATKDAAAKYGIHPGTYDRIDADLALVCVKPHVVADVLRELAAADYTGLTVSIAAGVPLQLLERSLGEGRPAVRVMPNTPVAVGAGMTSIAKGTHATDEHAETVRKIFATLGHAVIVTEPQLEALGALSGAGPGYAFVIIDALADAGVRIGLPRQLAIEAAAQTLFGAGKMQVETGKHPAVLRDLVTSPGGTTIAGIHAMEAGGLRAALIDGVVACYEKALQMSDEQ